MRSCTKEEGKVVSDYPYPIDILIRYEVMRSVMGVYCLCAYLNCKKKREKTPCFRMRIGLDWLSGKGVEEARW